MTRDTTLSSANVCSESCANGQFGMISIEGLTKKYGDHIALSDVGFTVRPGEVVGFLGPNGAGKTTTMNIIAGYVQPSSGTVSVDGYDVRRDPIEVKKRIGYLPEMAPLYGHLTIDEHLRFVCQVRDVEPSERDSHISSICDALGLTGMGGRLIRNLSRGYRQRVGMAQALIGDPPVLILDEPTVGFDPQQMIEMRRLIRSLSGEHTIILSSHILSEVSAVCDRVVIINEGKIVAEDTPENLARRQFGKSRLLVRARGPANEVVDKIRVIPGVVTAHSEDERELGTTDVVVEAESGLDVRDSLSMALCKAGMPILMMRPRESDLERIFLDLTQTDDEEGK